jgi:predicted N-acyltransferase
MPSFRPVTNLLKKARDAHSRHRDRHRPTDFGFALADRVDYLDGTAWDGLTAQDSVFLSRRYLRILEDCGPKNIRQRYALVFRGREPVAAVAAQAVSASAAQISKEAASKAVSSALKHVDQQILVCGNLLSWGFHGVAFAPGVDRREIWAAVADALYRIRRADRLFGDTDFVLVKDVTDPHAADAEALKRYSYRPLETEPNMVLEIAPSWQRYDDYLAGLTANYRKSAKNIARDCAAAGYCVDRLSDVDSHAKTLHDLYLQVHERQKFRLVTLAPEFVPALAHAFPDDFRVTVVRRDDDVAGFVTTLRDRDTAVGYYVGFDSAVNAKTPLYFRLLHAVVQDAIEMGCRRVSLGRTALEPKARLGARPAPMRVWVRHRVPALNVVVRSLLRTVPHDEAPDRNPFK